ncbi:unnamed protein product [Owenia fusiformis]|uniref:Uncharacterized protein n=1 Tax=Owenia fusiformis TaxID=6347 RepID=A0A8J1U6R6_OWEFU|nr:unnamed protein product [Owenia fusiformis]
MASLGKNTLLVVRSLNDKGHRILRHTLQGKWAVTIEATGKGERGYATGCDPFGHQRFKSTCGSLNHTSIRNKYVKASTEPMEQTAGNNLIRNNAKNDLLHWTEKTLTVSWADGQQDSYNATWLRYNCHCPLCKQEHSGQRLLDIWSLPPAFSLQSARIQGEDVCLEWEGNDHKGRIPLSFLQEYNYAVKTAKDVTDQRISSALKGDIKEVDYFDIMDNRDAQWQYLKNLNEDGICLVKNVPTVDKTVKKVAEVIAPIQGTIYGETFDVVTTDKPINAAYSTVGLQYHMDLVYYESPPGLQFLHCLRNDPCVKGGESIFLDIFHIAEEMRQLYPEKFEVLCRVPATFQKIHYERERPVHMVYQRPHIILNHNDQITGVHWSPQFEGPLMAQPGDVEPYYDAYNTLTRLMTQSHAQKMMKLQPGDCIVFNNRRVLHGRQPFEDNGGVRHLQGTYVNIDEFLSQYIVLCNITGNPDIAKRVGNQCFS